MGGKEAKQTHCRHSVRSEQGPFTSQGVASSQWPHRRPNANICNNGPANIKGRFNYILSNKSLKRLLIINGQNEMYFKSTLPGRFPKVPHFCKCRIRSVRTTAAVAVLSCPSQHHTGSRTPREASPCLFFNKSIAVSFSVLF